MSELRSPLATARRSVARRRGLRAFVVAALVTSVVGAVRADDGTPLDGVEEARHLPREYHGGTAPAAPGSERGPAEGAEGADGAMESSSDLERWWSGDALTGTWAGVRPRAEDAGVRFEGSWTVDLSTVLHGGLHRRGVQRSLVDLAVRADLERLAGVGGATVYADYQVLTGANGSDDVGDIQGYSNIDARDLAQLSELWFEDRLLDGRVRIKVGKVDANTEFAFAENAALFLGSSMGLSPTVLLPTYPDPATSVNLFVAPGGGGYAGVAVYDGAAYRGVHTGSRGPSTFFDDLGELFTIGEVGAGWGEARPGRLGVGGWYLDGAFDVGDGSGEVDHQRGTCGAYLVLDQKLWSESETTADDQGVAGFLMWGWTERAVAELADHVGGGLAWRGLVPTRDGDELGVGATWVGAGGGLDPQITRDHEVATEIYYAADVNGWLSLEPDLQWVVSPLGSPAARDAWVGTIRITAAL